METWSTTPGPVHITPVKPEKKTILARYSNWLSNYPNIFFPQFCVGQKTDRITDGTVMIDYFSNFYNKKKKKSRGRIKSRRRAGRYRMDPHA